MAISFKLLKLLRIAVSAAFFMVLTVAFLSLDPRLAAAAQPELLPAAVRFLFRFDLWALAAVVFLLGVTLVFGRLFCSFGCPMGFLQDIASRVGRLFGGRCCRLPDFRRFRYLFVLGLIGFAVGGVMLPVGWFDPFSLFGRNVNAFGQPALISVNHFIWNALGGSVVTPMDPKPAVDWSVAAVPLAIFLATLGAAAWRGRVFCNLCCPVGTVLGAVSRFARKPLRLDGADCVKCGKCVRVCKSGCIDIRHGTLDFERCVGCFDCGNVCHFDAIRFGRPEREGGSDVADPSRRGFMISAGAVALAAGCGGALTRKLAAPGGSGRLPVMPPGAGSAEHFIRNCTGCQLCVANCTGRTLKPAVMEYGLAGFGLPRLSFDMGRCEFNCNNCSVVCPTGALERLTLGRKQRERIGLVRYIRELCVVVTDGTSCGACAEHCPTGALQMVPYQGGVTIPKVISEICIGCGGCEFICPVRPARAIVVDGVAGQSPAGDPGAVLKKEREEKENTEGDFPF